jgi:hypothetical protein
MTALKTLHSLSDMHGSPVKEKTVLSQANDGSEEIECLEIGISSSFKELPIHPRSAQISYTANRYWTGIEPKFKITLYKQPITPIHRYETYQASITRFDVANANAINRPKTTSISLNVGQNIDPLPIMQEIGAWVMHCRPDIAAMFFLEHSDFYPDIEELHQQIEQSLNSISDRIQKEHQRQQRAKHEKKAGCIADPLSIAIAPEKRARAIEDEYFAAQERQRLETERNTRRMSKMQRLVHERRRLEREGRAHLKKKLQP